MTPLELMNLALEEAAKHRADVETHLKDIVLDDSHSQVAAVTSALLAVAASNGALALAQTMHAQALTENTTAMTTHTEELDRLMSRAEKDANDRVGRQNDELERLTRTVKDLNDTVHRHTLFG